MGPMPNRIKVRKLIANKDIINNIFTPFLEEPLFAFPFHLFDEYMGGEKETP